MRFGNTPWSPPSLYQTQPLSKGQAHNNNLVPLYRQQGYNMDTYEKCRHFLQSHFSSPPPPAQYHVIRINQSQHSISMIHTHTQLNGWILREWYYLTFKKISVHISGKPCLSRDTSRDTYHVTHCKKEFALHYLTPCKSSLVGKYRITIYYVSARAL